MDNPISRPLMAPAGQNINDRNNDWSMVDLSLGARVARGVLYIDRCYPFALSNMDIARFDIALGDRCIIGQVYGYYIGTPEYDLGCDFLRAHGFLPFESDEHTWWTDECDLNTAWRQVIRERREAQR